MPDVVQLVQLREKLSLSLDWVLLGTGGMLYEPTSAAERVPERFRAALTQHLSTSGLEVEFSPLKDRAARSSQPRAMDYDMVLPGADVVFRLAAELVRPLLQPGLRRIMVWDWWHRRVGRLVSEGKSALKVEHELDAECEAELEEGRVDLIALARYAEAINRKRRPLFQIINYTEAGIYDESGPTSAWGTLDPSARRSKRR